MYKRFFEWCIACIMIAMFTGCVQREVQLVPPPTPPANPYDVNDVDMSDLDENLTESEMMMTEEGEETKMARIPFPSSEYYKLARMGKGTIKGTIYVNNLYDERVVGAGTRLYLNPVTSYSKQWYIESYLGGNRMEKADSRLFNYLRFTAADSQGKFAFYGVPSGSYYLIGTVKCAQECGYESEKSIRIATRVAIRGNQVITKDLTRISE